MATQATSSRATSSQATSAEAAQFALLSRISAALRHRFVGKLQPLAITAAVAEIQLRDPTPNLPGARESIVSIQRQLRDAKSAATATLAWLTGEEAPSIGLSDGVTECLNLIRIDSELRGVAIVAAIEPITAHVSRRALRLVLTASLIALVDQSPPPREITVRATVIDKQIELLLHMGIAMASAGAFASGDGRSMRWRDAQALAQLVDVKVSRSPKLQLAKCIFDIVPSDQATTSA